MKKIILFVMMSVLLSVYGDNLGKDWQPLFKEDLSNAIIHNKSKTGWKFENGVLKSECRNELQTKDKYENYHLSLEFKCTENSNSGVFIYLNDGKGHLLTRCCEVQLIDNRSWKGLKADQKCGSIYGFVAANSEDATKPAGEWNKLDIICNGKLVSVMINGKKVSEIDMGKWTSTKVSPDGKELKGNPFYTVARNDLPTKGYIAFQGRHGEKDHLDATIDFRNIKIKSLEK